jgi:glyoxylase-like metal-dependent hydrolase (beta-lactamase superfamily II)
MRRLVIALAGAILIAAGAGWWWMQRTLPAEATAREHPLVGEIYQVADRLYVVPGGGGNTAVFVTASGVVLVDTKYPERYQAMLDQVRTVTDKPIAYVINTHCHADHVGGNDLLPRSTEIVVQENTARNIEKMRRASKTAEPPDRILRTYKDRLTLLDGADAIDLYYFGPAHTDGDTFVVFRSAGVMHAGDVFPGRVPPVINIPWGGNGAMFPDTLDKAIGTITGVHSVITGHAGVLPWQDFVEYAEFNRLLLDHVRARRNANMAKVEAFKDLHLPAKFKDYRLERAFATMDEIDRSVTPWWRRLWLR